MKLFPFFGQTQKCKDLQHMVTSSRADMLVDDIQDADMILVWWGDGWMLHAMRQYHDHQLPFFGLNCGTLWFLTNKHCERCLDQLRDQQLNYVSVRSLDTTLETATWEQIQWFAWNDLVVWGSVFDYSHFTIHTDEELQVSGTGLVVSTALWSTAYAANLWAPLIPLDSNLWSICGIGTGEYRYGFVSPDSLWDITIDVQSRSPISVALDGYNQVHTNITKIQLRPGTHTATLAFLSSEHFAQRRLLLAEKKLGR